MKILVCLGHVPDTTTKVKLTDSDSQFDRSGVQWVINPWDELALTRAMELKEDGNNPVDQITVVTVGDASAESTIRKALAIGADQGVRINADPMDASFVAQQMAEIVKRDGYELILCGIESSDYNGSAVGSMLAEFLDLPSVSAVSGLSMNASELTVKRDIDGGYEMINIEVPVVLVVQKGIAKEPRIPAMRGIMMARKKPLEVVEPIDVPRMTSISRLELPKPKPPCKMVDPEQVDELVRLLHQEAKVL